LRLAGCVSVGSGVYNEDAAGHIMHGDEVTAAWVFDGVTGINGRNYLPGPTDAAWLVDRAGSHLNDLAAQEIDLPVLLAVLVDRLQQDWRSAVSGLALPDGYDIPAACLVLVKKYADGWKALRLGDSMLLVEHELVRLVPPPDSDLNTLEAFLREEARRRRAHGTSDFQALLKEFHPRLMAGRRARNTASNHSILVADPSSLNCPEYLDLGHPESLLLCTDGFYRAVDNYSLTNDAGLVAACRIAGGAGQVLHEIRKIEAEDPDCEKYLRFKPADDASAVMLVR
jgi:Protein phosphatase 2C